MTPRVRFGLILGGFGFVLNICVGALFGICGPVVALVAAAVAGYLAVQAENPTEQSEGARAGAVSGAIAGALVLGGQMLGVVASLTLVQSLGLETSFGQIPTPEIEQTFYWLGGLGVGLCIGLVDVAIGAGAGAAAGYLGTPSNPG